MRRLKTCAYRRSPSPEDVLDALGYHIPVPAVIGDGEAPAGLTAFEQRIYDVLTAEPMHIDVLSEATGLAASDILVNLLSLEFKGLARQMAGKMFLRLRIGD